MTSTSSALDAQIAELADREEIFKLIRGYCRLCDANDGPGVAELFTDDCRYDHGPGENDKVQGRDRLAKLLTHLLAEFSHTSHHSSNEEITFDGHDRATGVSYILGWHEFRNGTKAVAYGQYEDVFVRTPAGWRIDERKVVAHGHENFDFDMHWLPRHTSQKVTE